MQKTATLTTGDRMVLLALTIGASAVLGAVWSPPVPIFAHGDDHDHIHYADAGHAHDPRDIYRLEAAIQSVVEQCRADGSGAISC